MRVLTSLLLAVPVALGLGVGAASANPPTPAPQMIEDFTMQPETRWRFFTDGVMGGISTGELLMITGDGPPHARMTGHVSTANRGGFIQMRHDLNAPPPAGTQGLRLIVRGNNQRYFAHLRTKGTLLPWQYYQAPFEVTESWQEVQLPFSAFKPSGRMLRAVPDPHALTSVAVVAYGRDHEAEVEVREVGFY
ncbi:complex I intermediate-associated protein 30 (CIA30) [Rhodobacter aestuarii]|uniref:Complex I intermediate-associated protein 30 (CIA30) n=1 Tax=Rhodobacter aestuarii TaxID=453582 RepID=A0A1N7NUA4_9RHOB|nr:CIA30 family protein [Rhodobacter aestuarii]PTV94550.1 complex I intermediate-associated protein 30 (CIA30) [Rhodobacter aestuarii]SIT01856.1 Complex I intermediate-associated protein 30 (CIA30) [Rhodobacter aestuarii]